MFNTRKPVKPKWTIIGEKYYYYYLKKTFYQGSYKYRISVYIRNIVPCNQGVSLGFWMDDCPEHLVQTCVGSITHQTNQIDIDPETYNICNEDEKICLTLLSI